MSGRCLIFLLLKFIKHDIIYAKSKVRMRENTLETKFPKVFSGNSSAPATEENLRFCEVCFEQRKVK